MSEIKNIPVSISERLKNIARDSGKAFDSLILSILHGLLPK
ncbi:hypothetical protein [Paenibacillus ferrarius]|nr:hypothetical protein [Paenibacillus ferrarius]